MRADGIVVLTGGSSRVADAIELLANGYGRRLLISGVHWMNGTADISRSLPELFAAPDLLHRSRPFRGQHAEQRVGDRRWARDRGLRSLIIVTSNYHMPRAFVRTGRSDAPM